ncbi:MAG: hypothetical protein K2J85_01765, partial [Anaeroplasmataceae bacterium]|nr:hypothetical protein [Anaeroplasmataceae bacterium]
MKDTETEFLNAGTYSIEIVLSSEDSLNFNLIETDYEVTIAKATISSIDWAGATDIVYTGLVHHVTAVAKWGNDQSINLTVQVAEDKEILNVGTYTVEVSYMDANFEALSETKTIVVKPAIVTADIANNHYVYDGEEKSATIELVGDLKPEDYTISYELDDYTSTTGATHAGTYTIVISLEENGNFSFAEGYSTSSTLTIDKVLIGITVDLGSYTGEPHQANVEFNALPAQQKVGHRISLASSTSTLDFVLGTDYTIEYVGEGLVNGLPVNAGTYKVIVDFISPYATNYSIQGSEDGKFIKEFTLSKAIIHMTWSDELEFADDAEIKTPYIYDGPWADMLIIVYKDSNGNILKSAPEVGGEYTVEVQLKDTTNFELSGDISKTFNIISVSQADLTMYLWIILFLLVIIVLLIIVIMMLIIKNKKNNDQPVVVVTKAEPAQSIQEKETSALEEPAQDVQEEEIQPSEEPTDEVLNLDMPVDEDIEEHEEEEDDEDDEEEDEEETAVEDETEE